jgi:protein TonB
VKRILILAACLAAAVACETPRTREPELVDYVEAPDSAAGQPADASQPDEHGIYDLASVDEQPSLLNRDEVQKAAERTYPPLLREAGISGTVQAEFVVGAGGRPLGFAVARSSDYPDFDVAAAGVVRAMRFTPAKVRGRAVPVRVVVPIVYRIE